MPLHKAQKQNLCNDKLNSLIFATKNNQLTIFGQTLDNIRNKLIHFNEIWIQGGRMSAKSQAIPEEKLLQELSFDDAKRMLDSFNESVVYGGQTLEKYFEKYPKHKNYLETYVTTTEQQKQSVQGLMKATHEARSEQLKQNEAIKAQTISAKAGSVAMRTLATAGNMLLMYGISKGIELVATGIDNLVHSAEHCKERVNELMSSYKSALDTANSNAKTVESFASRYKELSSGVNGFGRNLSLTTEEYKEYNNIVNQIADMFPDMVRGYTSEGNAILSLKGNVEQLRDAYKDAQQEAYNMLIASGENGDGNDIIKNWENLHETSLAAKLFDFGFEDMGGKLSTKEAVEQLDAFSGMSAKRFREVKQYTMYEYDPEKTDSLSDIEKEIGYGTYIYKALGVDEGSTDEELAEAKRRARALVLTYQAEIDAALNDMHLLANAYLMTSEDYGKMDEQSRNMASMIVNGFGEDIANGFNGKADVATYVTDVVSMLKDDSDVQNALSGLLTTDFASLSREEAKAIIGQYVDTIENSANGELIDLNKLLGFSELEEGDILTLDDMVDKLRKLQGTGTIQTPYKDALDDVQALSGKLDTLQDVYDGIQNDGEFDWSSILNNEGFENAFKNAGSVYDDFIRTVTQNSNDIEACQNAFDQLATTVLNNSGVFDDLTEETKDRHTTSTNHFI